MIVYSKIYLDSVIEYPLTEEFLQVELTIKGKTIKEYHAHIFKPPEIKRNVYENPRRLDIAVIMIDSQSNANVQRHMKKTYKFLDEDENSFILKVTRHQFLFIAICLI